MTLFGIELFAALAAGGIVYLTLAPIAMRERGYFALGGEFMAAYVVAALVFYAVHEGIWSDKKKGEKHGRNREQRTKPVGRKHADDGGAERGRGNGNPKARIHYSPLR